MKKTLILVTALIAGFSVQKGFAQTTSSQADEELISVYSWWNTSDHTYETVAEGEYQDGQMLNWGWKDKKLMFVAFRQAAPGRVAVYSWMNPVTKDQASMAEDEFTDDQMIKMGYTSKKLQFYALTRRGPNTMPIYRWRIQKNDDWVNVPEEGNTDVYIKKGYHHKTFQFFGIPRAPDVKVYNQL